MDLPRLQRAPQRLDGSRPFASCQQRRHRFHEPHHAEEFTLRDVVNDRRVLVGFEAVSGRASIRSEPNQRRVSRNPIRNGGW